MQPRTHNLIAGGVAVLIAALSLFYFTRSVGNTGPVASTPGSSTGNGPGPIDLSKFNSTTTIQQNGYTIELLTERNAPTAPTLDAVTFPSTFTAAQKTAAQARVDTYLAAISQNPYDFNAWVNLAGQYQITGDYTQAASIYLYLNKLYPSNKVAHANLAYIEDVYLKNYKVAETQYRLAIKNNPTDPQSYRNLGDMYEYRYKVAGAEEAVLKQGIAAVPKAIDLRVLLARYYVRTRNTAAARTTYDDAISAARASGQSELAAQIATEARAL